MNKDTPMKKFFALPVIIVAGLVTTVATANNQAATAIDLYKIRYMKNCQTIAEKPMTHAQVDSYLEMQQFAEQMNEIQQPISKMQPELDELTNKIKQISGEAVIESDEGLHINKQLLKQQTEYAHKIEQLVSKHKNDFDALENMGQKVSAAAHDFERQIKSSAQNLDYDNIQIVTPDSNKHNNVCVSGINKV